MSEEPRLALAASDTPAAQAAYEAMLDQHDWVPLARPIPWWCWAATASC
jgi:NAD+ kinase